MTHATAIISAESPRSKKLKVCPGQAQKIVSFNHSRRSPPKPEFIDHALGANVNFDVFL
jgi:hypothetical protein